MLLCDVSSDSEFSVGVLDWLSLSHYLQEEDLLEEVTEVIAEFEDN